MRMDMQLGYFNVGILLNNAFMELIIQSSIHFRIVWMFRFSIIHILTYIT